MLELLRRLIRCRSITPNDAGCQDIITERLAPLGFHIERLRFKEVDNLWARLGNTSPLLVFAGHTDVVPPGTESAWSFPPFEPLERDGYIYGRGAADMKSGLATMIAAAESFIRKNPNYNGSIGFLITSDEEGPSINGTKKVMEYLTQRGEKIDYCIIGEASSEKTIADQIRIGRRGSLHGKLIIEGQQGHVAYPERALNPIHTAAPFLKEIASIKWDKGNKFFPPTSFQISNIHAGVGAANVIPGSLEILFNFRFGTASTVEKLQTRVVKLLEKHSLSFDLQWDISGHPFLTQKGKLITAAKKAIEQIAHVDPTLSTGGGTSDGRFIAPTGAEVIELGPINTTVHQVNEHVKIADLYILTNIYERIMEHILLL